MLLIIMYKCVISTVPVTQKIKRYSMEMDPDKCTIKAYVWDYVNPKTHGNLLELLN